MTVCGHCGDTHQVWAVFEATYYRTWAKGEDISINPKHIYTEQHQIPCPECTGGQR